MVCVQRCLVVTWLVPRETAAVSVQGLSTPYNHVPVYSVSLLEAASCLTDLSLLLQSAFDKIKFIN